MIPQIAIGLYLIFWGASELIEAKQRNKAIREAYIAPVAVHPAGSCERTELGYVCSDVTK